MRLSPCRQPAEGGVVSHRQQRGILPAATALVRQDAILTLPKTPRQAPLPRSHHPSMTEYRLFLGNPGVGRSTLINCMLGRAVFQSGLSFGSGMTVKLQEHTADNGVVYLDAPGLADVTIRQQAAREIEKALRKGGVYKLFFLAGLKNGRVSPEDITTFNQVINAIDVPNLKFSVVINNIKPRQFEMLTGNEDNFCRIAAAVNALPVKTTSIALLPVLPDLDEATDAFTQLPSEFADFIDNAPTVEIPRESVRDIDVNAALFARQLEVLEGVLRLLQDDNNTLRFRIQELEQGDPGLLNRVFRALIPRWAQFLLRVLTRSTPKGHVDFPLVLVFLCGVEPLGAII